MSYSPKIHKSLIRRLYLLKQRLKIPMTKMVGQAVEQYLKRKEIRKQCRERNS